MKRYLLLFAALYMVTAGHAQKKNFSYKFYGQVRGDLVRTYLLAFGNDIA